MSLALVDIPVVQDDAVGHPQSPPTPLVGEREVDLRRQHLRQIMQSECRLVGKNAFPLRPKPYDGQVLVVARGKMHEAVDASASSEHTPGREMVGEKLRRVSGLSRLLRRKEPVLGRRSLEEVVPVGRADSYLAHASILSETLVSRKRAALESTRSRLGIDSVRRGTSSANPGRPDEVPKELDPPNGRSRANAKGVRHSNPGSAQRHPGERHPRIPNAESVANLHLHLIPRYEGEWASPWRHPLGIAQEGRYREVPQHETGYGLLSEEIAHGGRRQDPLRQGVEPLAVSRLNAPDVFFCKRPKAKMDLSKQDITSPLLESPLESLLEPLLQSLLQSLLTKLLCGRHDGLSCFRSHFRGQELGELHRGNIADF